MKKYITCILLSVLFLLCTACQKEEKTLHYLESADGAAVEIRNSYYTLRERFPELYQQLYFTIDLPETAELYDSGKSDGVVRFSDSSGKNLITLETRFKEQPERCYQQYLHNICTNLSKLESFHEYEETFTVNGYSARRIDFRQDTGEEMHLVSYWFITVPESPETATYYHQSGICIVSVESVAENIEPMLRILNTFRMRGD